MTRVSPAATRQIIGVTGNIASGKSTVVGILRDLGVDAIDADVVYHELIRPGAPLWLALRHRFGDAILAPDQTIDRRALGRGVFANAAALSDLDRLTHPAIVADIRQRLTDSTGKLIVVDAVKLVESGLAAECDYLWVVTAASPQQIERLVARNGLSQTEAEQRVSSQPEIAPKLAVADLIIDNSGTIEETRRQVEAGWRRISMPGPPEPHVQLSERARQACDATHEEKDDHDSTNRIRRLL